MNNILKILTLSMLLSFLASCTSTSTSTSGTSSSSDDVSDSGATTVSVNDNSTVSDVDASPEAGLNSVFYFEFDKSNLTSQAMADLDAYAVALRASPRNIRLEGHGDERGTREYNIALGERRAKTVADYLTASGVNSSRIETISYGEERPASRGSNEEAWAKSRRVELH